MDAMLDAVNACLAGIGQSPVSSVDEPSLDSAMAVQVIEKTSRDIQSRGWWFNKEANWKLRPDPHTGFLSPPLNAISVVNADRQRYRQLTIRGSRIYNVDNHTYDIRDAADANGDILFTFVIHLEFNDLPPVAQYAIGETAKRIFAQNLEVDPNRWNFQRQDEDKAIAALYREDGRNNRRNYIRDSPAMRSTLGLIGGSWKPF